MNRIICIAMIAAMSLWCISPSMAEVGVTDACQKDVKELEDDIDDNKDDYTAESRRKARQHLMAAKTNRLNQQNVAAISLKPARNFEKENGTKKRRIRYSLQCFSP